MELPASETIPASKPSVLVVGDLNVDFIIYGLSEPPSLDHEMIVDRYKFTTGGSCGQFSLALAAMGASPQLVAKVGDDLFGRFLIDALSNNGVDVTSVVIDTKHYTGWTLCLSYPQDRAQITFPGALAYLRLEDVEERNLRGASHLHVSSLFTLHELRRDIRLLLQRAKEYGLTVSLDPQGDPDGAWEGWHGDMLSFVDLFLPNEREALAITKAATVEKALSGLSKKCPGVVVKLSHRGSLADLDSGRFVTPPYPVQAVDTTGAGDCFDAALVYAFMLKHMEAAEALAFANVYAAASVTRVLSPGSFPTLADVARLQGVGSD